MSDAPPTSPAAAPRPEQADAAGPRADLQPDENPPNSAPPVSVVILTMNEEANLPGALKSCAWCNDIWVLDSGSNDATVQVAQAAGAGVRTNPFESFGKQRNWAIDNLPLRHDWVFHLDADEHFTPALVAEIGHAIARNHDAFDGYHVAHKLMLGGQWLRRAGGFPVYQMRLFHRSRMRFIDHGHGQREHPDAKISRLDEPYLHFAFSKGLEDWLDKHNRYAHAEARTLAQGAALNEGISGLLSRDGIRRRRALKALSYRLPFRPTLRWLMIMVAKGGLLDGRAGWLYARMNATYERMIDLHRVAEGRLDTPPNPPSTPTVPSGKELK